MYVINQVNQTITLKIPSQVYKIFEKYKQKSDYSSEACGILIGSHSIDSKRVKIESITEPNNNDKRSRYGFQMNSRYHQEFLDSFFLRSENEFVYLGTWHSHPEKRPNPSRKDILDWKKQFKCNCHIFPFMIFAIVGIDQIIFWLIDQNGLYRVDTSRIIYEQ